VSCSAGAQPAVLELDLDADHNGGNLNVTGDVSTLAPLVGLTRLDLYQTKAVGDVKGLATLVELTELWLGDTLVGGDVAGLAPLVKLRKLGLGITRVAGDVAGLAPLVKLDYLFFDGTKTVTGCGAFCGAGGSFHTHCTSSFDCVCSC
jgi:hypothetical protein